MRTVLLFTLAATLVLAPVAQAHGSPNPIEAEDLILDDEATDMILWDGWDIQALHIREAYMQGTDGIVVRWTLWGGDSVGLAESSTLELSFDGGLTKAVSWESNDMGATWMPGPRELHELTDGQQIPACTVDGFVLETEYEQDEAPGLGVPTWNLQFQAFVPLCELGLELGDSLDAITARSYADSALIDVAPGPFYSPATTEVPLMDPLDMDSTRLIESLLLDGPDRYTTSTLTLDDGTLNVAVENLIAVSGQHVFVKTTLEPSDEGHEHDEEGNHIGGGQEAEAGQDLNFTLQVGDLDAPIQVFVETDLGGRETFWLQDDGTVTTTEPTNAGPGEQVEAPTAPLALLALALVAVAASRRR